MRCARVLSFLALAACLLPLPASAAPDATVPLPAVKADSPFPLEKALKERRSNRKLSPAALTLDQLSRLAWAAQGITDDKGHRTAPSARATYPLDVYVVAGNVTGLPAGLYRYVPEGHRLERVAAGDPRKAVNDAAIRQAWIADVPAWLVVTATPERARAKMGDGASRFAGTEAGIAAQNVLLEQVALGLAGTYVGGFDPATLAKALALPPGTDPWAVLPVGRPAN